jgi:N-acetylglucosamine malate deacetylase 1
MKRVLFVSVHPDDETLGCGGTILKHKSKGDEIYWLILVGPTKNHPYGFSDELIEQREEEIKTVASKYGFNKVINLNFPTQLLNEISFRELVVSVDKAITDIRPETIFIINRSDVHSDHKVAFDAVYACTKNFRKPFIEKILMYETLSETEFAPALRENVFVPNVFVDITDFMEKKIEIISMFASEVMPDNLPRSISAIRSLAGYRGSRIGVEFAEAFMLLFEKN